MVCCSRDNDRDNNDGRYQNLILDCDLTVTYDDNR